jgi:hypothetical protein
VTEEEGLKELCKRAANKNLYFSGVGTAGQIGARMETLGGPELPDLRELWGGKLVDGSGKGYYRPAWIIMDEAAEALIWKLLSRKDFKASGKFKFAADTLEATTGIPMIEIVRRANENS